MRKATIYASKTGVEIYEGYHEKEKKKVKVKEGRVILRAFRMEDPIHFKIKMTPQEAFYLALLIEKALKKGETVKALYHKFPTKNGEVSSWVNIEPFKKGDKHYIAIVVARDAGDKKPTAINVPMTAADALYLAHFLKQLSYEMSYQNIEVIEDADEVADASEEGFEEVVSEF